MESLSVYHKITAVTRVAGLLLDPKFHSNTFRIEALLHALMAQCSGSLVPTSGEIMQWLNEYEPIREIAYQEDPPEDTFVSTVTTPSGDCRIFGGLWEGYAFYLQRVLNVVETIPPAMGGIQLKKSIQALLNISQEIANRNHVKRYIIAPAHDKQTIPVPSSHVLEQLAQTLFFSPEDLARLGCTAEDLEPFILPEVEHKKVQNYSHGLTNLVMRPLMRDGKNIIVVLPTAITWSIRVFSFAWLREKKLEEKFNTNLVSEYINFLKDLPVYGRFIHNKVVKKHDSYFVESAVEFEPNMYLQIIVVIDTLTDWDQGINEPLGNHMELSDAVVSRIAQVRNFCAAKPGFREGLTLVILAGYGRAQFLGMSPPETSDWDVCGITANDFETMVFLARSNRKTIWKFTKFQRQLEAMNIRFQNMNGLLNLYGWWEQNDHMLIPSSLSVTVAGEQMNLISIPTDCLAKVRRRAWAAVDNRSARYIDGKFKQVRKKHLSTHFKDDEGSILYVSYSDIHLKRIAGCAITKKRVWWVALAAGESELSGEIRFRTWDAIHNWIEKIALVLDQEFLSKPNVPVLFELNMSQLKQYKSLADYPKSVASEKIASYGISGDTITISLNQAFLYFMNNPKNISEAAVVRCCVESYMDWAATEKSEAMMERLIKRIIPNDGARFIHAFSSKNFREMMRASISASYETIDNADTSILRIGLGHFSQPGAKKITGQDECRKYMEALVDHVYSKLRTELKKFNRAEFIKAFLENIEGIAAERSQWQRTMKAVFDLRKNKQSVFEGKAKHFATLTAADIACRILVEIALCESPLEGGLSVTSFDFSPFMALANMLFHHGNISDGIDKGEIMPEIVIPPSGDVKTDQSFRQAIFDKVVMQYEDQATAESVETYEKNFADPSEFEPAKKTLEEDFLNAFKAEFKADVEDIRLFLQEIEEVGYEKDQMVFVVPQSELIAHVRKHKLLSERALMNILNSFSSKPRDRWDAVPPGFVRRDLNPWLFRRRLSLLLKPIIRLDDSEDPQYIISPGFCVDSIIYTMDLYRHSGMEEERCTSSEMKKWVGDERVRRGARFTKEAAEVIESLGYSVKIDVKPTAIFQKSVLNKDYGDFDIIAWKENEKKIYLIECKKLLYAKTFREVAEQLQEFKGVTRSGKDDRLKRHLDRVTLAGQNMNDINRFCGISDGIIVPIILFSNPVPVLYDRPRADVAFKFLDEIKYTALD